jgi:cell division septation protein DedD
MSVWKHLPKSSGLGKLSKKHKKAFTKSQAYKKSHRITIKVKKSKVAPAKKVKATVAKPQPSTWHIWGSRPTRTAANAIASQLRRQGYKVKIVHADKMYYIHTQGRASNYS